MTRWENPCPECQRLRLAAQARLAQDPNLPRRGPKGDPSNMARVWYLNANYLELFDLLAECRNPDHVRQPMLQ